MPITGYINSSIKTSPAGVLFHQIGTWPYSDGFTFIRMFDATDYVPVITYVYETPHQSAPLSQTQIATSTVAKLDWPTVNPADVTLWGQHGNRVSAPILMVNNEIHVDVSALPLGLYSVIGMSGDPTLRALVLRVE